MASYFLVLIIAFAIVLLLYIADRNSSFFNRKPPLNFQNAHLVKILLRLDQKSLDELFRLYKNEFGAGAARYARQTFKKWKEGSVRPNKQTFNRFFHNLPRVMSYDLKCEVLRLLMEEYCSRNDYRITIYTDDWERTLAPLIKDIIDKSYTVELPAQLERRLRWLSEGDMQAAQSILRRSQAEESKIALSMLGEEISAIENLLANVGGSGRRKITHRLKFPYGSVTLDIKRR